MCLKYSALKYNLQIMLQSLTRRSAPNARDPRKVIVVPGEGAPTRILFLGHSMSSQPPMDGMFTDFAEILHTIWDMKKNPRTRR